MKSMVSPEGLKPDLCFSAKWEFDFVCYGVVSCRHGLSFVSSEPSQKLKKLRLCWAG